MGRRAEKEPRPPRRLASVSMARKTYTLRSIDQDGVVHEVEIIPEQALDLGANVRQPGSAPPLTYFVRDEQLLVGEDGELIERESAVPIDYDDEDDPRDATT